MSWQGVTVRSLAGTKHVSWDQAYGFESRERSFLGRVQTRAALRLTDGTLVPVSPRWSGYRERQLVDDMHAAAVWYRVPQNRFVLQAWIRDHPPRFHPVIAGRPVGPLLVGVGTTCLALAAAFPFPVLHPHRKLDSLHQLASTVPVRLAHGRIWVAVAAVVGVALGSIGLLMVAPKVGRAAEPLPSDDTSVPTQARARGGTTSAFAVSAALVGLAAPVWFWVLVQGLPPQLGVLAVAILVAVGVLALGMAADLAVRGRARGERFTLRGYGYWRHALR